MEIDTIVINSGPLILLNRIQETAILGKMPYRFICPPAVRNELDDGVHLGYTMVAPEWLKVRQLSSPVSPIMVQFLDRGEAEVIQLALDHNIRHVCLDDLRGRKVAHATGLKVMGLLAILARAKKLGIIPRLKPLSDKLLVAGAWYSSKLIAEVLAEVGEG